MHFHSVHDERIGVGIEWPRGEVRHSLSSTDWIQRYIRRKSVTEQTVPENYLKKYSKSLAYVVGSTLPSCITMKMQTGHRQGGMTMANYSGWSCIREQRKEKKLL